MIEFSFINFFEPNFWIVSDLWIRADNFNELVLKTISAVLLAPMLEELLYRGLLLDEQLEHQSERKAIIINTLFFSPPFYFKPLYSFGGIFTGKILC